MRYDERAEVEHMFDLGRVIVHCAYEGCPRQGRPFAFLNLGPGDAVRVICPHCGWVSTLRVGEDGRVRIERRTGVGGGAGIPLRAPRPVR